MLCAGLGLDDPPPTEIPPLPEPLAPDPDPGMTPTEALLLDRVQQLEATIQRLNDQVEQLQGQVQAGAPQAAPGGAALAPPPPGVPPEAAALAPISPGMPAPRSFGDVAAPPPPPQPPTSALGLSGGPGFGGAAPPLPTPGRGQTDRRPITDIRNYAPFTAPATPDTQMPATPRAAELRGLFGRGFQLASEDEEFLLQVNNFTMFDGQLNTPPDQALVEDGFSLPLALLIFSGRITRWLEYEATFGNAFTFPRPNTFKTVFFYADIRTDDRFIVRIGQQRVPFTYEYYYAPFSGLINLDWSLFFHNFSPLAAPGINVMGQLFDGRLDYATGVFDAPLIGSALGNPISHGNIHGSKSVFGLINTRPFRHSGRPWLEPLNLGGSFFVGDQRGDSIPRFMVAGLPSFGIPFLVFDPDVRLDGVSAGWAASLAYFRGPLSLQAEYEAGIQNLTAPQAPGLTDAAPQSFYVQAGYMLTGESVAGRGMVEPLRPLDPHRGRLGPGAWELAARYNTLSLDPVIFRRGLADRSLWASDLQTIDLGLNWYWNEYVKVSFGWKHIEFGSPVFRNPAQFQSSADQWILRFLLTF